MSVETGRRRRTRRVGVGIVELIPEPRVDHRLETLKANLHERSALLLVMILMAAQTADIVTTYSLLANNRYVEENPFFRVLIAHSPVAAYTVKLLLVLWLTLLAMSTLRGRRVVFALGLAAALSLSAPLLNFALLLHG